jgi:hypothetical protein
MKTSAKARINVEDSFYHQLVRKIRKYNQAKNGGGDSKKGSKKSKGKKGAGCSLL